MVCPNPCCIRLAYPTTKWMCEKIKALLFFQMSKSTGNFLTLTQAVDKFSADGKYVLTCIWLWIMPKWLKLVFCSQRSSGFIGVLNRNKSTAYNCSCLKSCTLFRKLECMLAQHLFQPRTAPGVETSRGAYFILPHLLKRSKHKTYCWCSGVYTCMLMFLFACSCFLDSDFGSLLVLGVCLVSFPRRAVYLSWVKRILCETSLSSWPGSL